MPDTNRPTNPPLHAPAYEPTEVIHIDGLVVACDGGGDALGHPRVWLRIPDGADRTLCPYCSRLYVANPGVGHASDH